jgi:hypothetical protein
LAVTSDRNQSTIRSVWQTLLIPAAVGLGVFAGLHVFFVMTWDRLFAWGAVHQAWWLNSEKSVDVTLVTLFFAALAVLSFSGTTWRGAVAMVAMWVGVLVAMPIMLATVSGEHNLWPIVLFMGGVLTGGAILLGMVAAVGVTKLVVAVGRIKHGR